MRHVQLSLDQARRPMGHGGWRPGAGRPRTRKGVSHDARENVAPTHPQHVTLRIVEGVRSLRRRPVVAVIRDAIARGHREDFRVTQFNVESNHLHLVIEASGNAARSRGLQGLKVRIAKRVNRVLGRSGSLFADRYHARALKTPREVRHALRYVLNNARHHQPGCVAFDGSWIDPCSSAAWFEGWREPIRPDTWWKRELLALPAPVARPTVWLLTVGWRRHGLLGFDEMPGSPR
jgi:REP element-mobilizing transposase RayT